MRDAPIASVLLGRVEELTRALQEARAGQAEALAAVETGRVERLEDLKAVHEAWEAQVQVLLKDNTARLRAEHANALKAATAAHVFETRQAAESFARKLAATQEHAAELRGKHAVAQDLMQAAVASMKGKLAASWAECTMGKVTAFASQDACGVAHAAALAAQDDLEWAKAMANDHQLSLVGQVKGVDGKWEAMHQGHLPAESTLLNMPRPLNTDGAEAQARLESALAESDAVGALLQEEELQHRATKDQAALCIAALEYSVAILELELVATDARAKLAQFAARKELDMAQTHALAIQAYLQRELQGARTSLKAALDTGDAVHQERVAQAGAYLTLLRQELQRLHVLQNGEVVQHQPAPAVAATAPVAGALQALADPVAQAGTKRQRGLQDQGPTLIPDPAAAREGAHATPRPLWTW